MRKALSTLLVTAVATTAATTGQAVENTWDNSVRASSAVQASPARITLNWPQDTKAVPSSYTVYRKAPGATSWGSGTQLSGNTTSYVDNNVTPGTAYEYRIVKVANGYTGYGYIQTGVNLPLVENRGKVVLVVDNTHATALKAELTRLEQDLIGDGWTVLRHDVSRNANVATVKNLIKAEYNADPTNVKSVFLFGRIPVPYSGEMAPDGHGDHRGAWPADAYYGDMDGNWTDNSVNYSQTINGNPAERTRLSNKPGDGKFDQSTLPSAVELQVGRVDLSNMPGLLWTGGPTTLPPEVDLLRQYLDKDHKFRHRILNPQRRGIVGDYFGWRGGEAFSSSAYGAYAAFFGADKTTNLNVKHNDAKNVWVPELAKNDYLTAFGAGAGSYATINGLGNAAANQTATTPEIYENNIKAVFTLLFGSWLGDWDSQDNFMRGVLATKDYGLTAAWSGRPHWFTHPMGLGETIGYTTRLTQNNTGIYQNQVDSSARGTHIALMGDPTLRLHPVVPASAFTGTRNGNVAVLTWKASSDTVLGYHVYRASAAKGPYTRLTTNLVTGTSFTDNNAPSGATYMLRAVKLESTPSGSYHNASQGLFWTAGGTPAPTPTDTAAPSVSVSAPVGGSTVGGSDVTVSANAFDDVGVAGVQFKLNGTNLGSEDTSAPYSVKWDTTKSANGSATLTAVARDAAGNQKTSSVVTVNVSNTTPTPTPNPTPNPVEPAPGNEGVVTWFDDALPAGAGGYGTGGGNWNWITSNPAPFSGAKAHQTILGSGLHEYAFQWASEAMDVLAGDTLVTYVYIDPANPPTTLMLAWKADNWEHRAYWGANEINYGTNGTAGRRSMGAIPAGGKWVRLEVPAKDVGLEGQKVTGMSISLFGGRATFDQTGKAGVGSEPVPVEPPDPVETVDTPWVDDALPKGATGYGSEAWNWVSSNPTPISGDKAHQSALASGLHEHAFQWASDPMSVAAGDTLYAYVYLDPANPPTALMVHWKSDSWEHRAYWGSDSISYGTSGTPGRYRAGDLPPTGKWVRLEVPAKAVGLEGASVSGMAFSAFNGRVTWDKSGTSSQASPAPVMDTLAPTASLSAPANNATVSGSVSVSANASDNVGVAGVQFKLNGANLGSEVTSAPYRMVWDTPEATNGKHTLTAVVRDAAGNKTTTAPVSVTVGNVVADTTAPTIALTAPRNNATVSRSVSIAANASDNVGVVGVQFKLDGADLGSEDTTSPYGITWDTTKIANGKHSLAAVVRDAAGNKTTSTNLTVTVANTTPTPTPVDPTPVEPAPGTGSVIAWFDDALPAGASGYGTGGGNWNWISSNPAPHSGTKAHQTILASGLHEYAFQWASDAMDVAANDTLVTYVYIDPANPPTTLMLAWKADNWEHRAYWGANEINYGTNGTAGRRSMGAIPAAGKWVRFEVPAKDVGLEGQKVTGMSISLFGGRATFDQSGKAGPATTPTPEPVDPVVPAPSESVWVDDVLPSGAAGYGDEPWSWVSANPAPFSGSKAHQSKLAAGLHEHAFQWATQKMNVAKGDTLFAYVYLDPANPPSQIMLHWKAESWEHRAYWGANKINYGTEGTAGRHHAGSLPATGRWVRLEVSAKDLGLEGATVTGMAFSAFDGRVTWDKTGTATGAATIPTPRPTPEPGPVVPPVDPVEPEPAPVEPAPQPEPEPEPTPEPVEFGENALIAMPKVGDHSLTILSSNVLELERITTKQPDPATVSDWNFVNANGQLNAPAASKFTVTVDGRAVSVKSVGFKRRVRYAPLDIRDLRIGNQLYLQLAEPIAEGKTVVVKNPDGSLWPASMTFTAKAEARRANPAIHVNQEGYVPAFPKKAMIGYYLGNLGELDVPATTFKLVNARTGATAYQGTLKARPDVGYTYSPKPYQKVLEADFSAYKTPGEYQLVVPGLGASLPFLINDGVAMGFLRTYALGLYHQRSGQANVMPYTRHVRGAAHTAPAEIPATLSGYEFTWATIAGKNADTATVNPPGVGKQLKDPASQLYPFVNKGKVDVSGGHFDAGDYSKYTINSATLAHYLLFTADSIAGAGALDNLGLPESADGIGDILQSAKHETDYISKLQDADGGFYFIVYPKTREYESNVTPDNGDTQVVWPKNTSATAASVAALAQAASSPKFKAAYPAESAKYLNQAKLGWQFLMNAISKHGKNGSYQKITFYGDNYIHNDEIAWAAAALYAATGEAQYQQKLMEWFPNPADPATMRWSWWRMSESYGHALRTYAFAARSGRLSANKLDSAYLAKAEEQIKLAGQDALKWTKDHAYGSAFPDSTKGVMSAGWYFSLDQASDMSVAYQIDPRPEYIDALVSNMNYEAGTNPVNVTYVTGLGLKRQREVVAQYAKNDRRVLAPAGIPIGNIQSNFDYLTNYGASGNELTKLSYPSDSGSNAPYPFYDRWADTWNVTTEFITVNQARSLLSVATLAAQTASKDKPWKSATARIVVPPAVVPLDQPVYLTLNTAGLDLTNARIIWEGRDQEPDFGSVYAFTPKNTGEQWVEAEITWPDGRRVVAASTFTANSPVVTWIDDALPSGAWVNGNESWNWVSGSPAPYSGSKAHQSGTGPGLHEHAFNDANSPLLIEAGDTLFAWVYLDPANPPTEIMIHWNDGTWDHRAYWGANQIEYGANNTASRHRVGDLPATGKWVKLEVPAKAVGLEGKSVKGMCFSTFNGRATWDATGRASQE